MKTLFRLLNLLLCLELIVSPVAPNLSLLGQKAMAEDGSCSTGFQWDSTLNRCLTSTETANVMNAVASCGAGDVECYKTNAESALKTKEANGDVSKAVASKGGALNAIAVVVPLSLTAYMLMEKRKNKSECKAYSLYAMTAAGAALWVGDLLADSQHKKRLKDIKKDWDKIINEGAAEETNSDVKKTNATEAQSQAFEMLARSEDSMAAAAKMKSAFFGTAMAAFAAAAAWSTYEAIDLARAAATSSTNGGTEYAAKLQKYTCGKSVDTNQRELSPALQEKFQNTAFNEPYFKYLNTNRKVVEHNLRNAPNLAAFQVLMDEYENPTASLSSPSLDKYEEAMGFHSSNDDKNLLSLIKEISLNVVSNLNPIPSAHAVETAVLMQSLGMTSKTVSSGIKTPAARAVLGAVLAGWSGVMFAHARKQKQVAEERAKLLRKMKEEFNIASGAINMCSAEDRSNTSKPECYCYTSEGQRNSNRTNSSICQKLWTGINTTEGNYYGSTASSTKGCISSSGSFDSTCSCKSSNSCLKASGTSGISGLSTGTFSMLSSPLSAIDSISNGTTDTATVNGDAAVSNAMRIMDATDKLANAKGAEEVKKAKAGSKALENSLITGAAGVNPGLASSSSGGLAGLSPKQAAAMLEKELDGNTIGAVSGNAGSMSPNSDGGGETPQLDFGMSGDQFNAQQGQVAEVMKENFDYGTNDINEGSKTNIFEVLSNRYQRSGMRRLFDEKGETKSDAPAKTDITK